MLAFQVSLSLVFRCATERAFLAPGEAVHALGGYLGQDGVDRTLFARTFPGLALGPPGGEPAGAASPWRIALVRGGGVGAVVHRVFVRERPGAFRPQHRPGAVAGDQAVDRDDDEQ